MKLKELEYTEEGFITHDGKPYDINKLFSITKSLPITNFPVDYLSWMNTGKLSSLDELRIDKVDLSIPIIVTPWQDRYVTVDGFHRTIKAIRNGMKYLPAKIIFDDTLALCKIEINNDKY